MSDLYDIFGAAASANPGLDKERREALVTAIGGAATRRRRRRGALTALASVASVGAIGGVIVGLGLGFGNDGSAAGPDTQPPAEPSVVLNTSTPSPDATASPAPGPTVWDLAEPGWFLLETRGAADAAQGDGARDVTRASGGDAILVGPDGRMYDAGSLDGVEYTEAIGWWGGELALYTETTPAGGNSGQGDVSMWSGGGLTLLAADVDATYLAAVVDDDSVVTSTPTEEGFELSVTEDFASEKPLCITSDDAGAAAVTPDGSALVCFAAVADDGTQAEVVPTVGHSTPTVLGSFTYPAWTYERIGWTGETELLFARFTDPGYRYFTLDIDTGDVTEVSLPDALEATLPTYDLASDTFTLLEQGAVRILTGDGDELAVVECSDTSGEPVVRLSGQRALVGCRDSGGSAWALSLVDLGTGAVTPVTTLDAVEGEDPLGSVWGYPSVRSAA